LKKLIFISIFVSLMTGPVVWARGNEEPNGGYISFRGGLSQGSTLYNQANYDIPGKYGQLEFGWRPGQFLKLGVFGLYENLDMRSGGTSTARVDMSGYGASLRLFFLPKVFIEGGYGGTQAYYQDAANSQVTFVADGTFYYGGMGLELELISGFTFEFGLRNREVTFPKGEFKNMRSQIYSAGINLYF